MAQPAPGRELRNLPRTAQDGILAGLLLALSFLPDLAGKGTTLGEIPPRPWDVVGLLLAAAMGVPLIVRRRWPGPVLAVVATAWAVSVAVPYDATPASLALFVVLYTAGTALGRPWWIAATAGYVVLAVVLDARGATETVADYVLYYAILAVCWAAGTWMRNRRAWEAAAERTRIARELHDVVTHHVTAMVVQADAARYVAEPDLSVISDAGRLALAELRQLLDVLHSGPEPRLNQLVDRARAAGQRVELVEDGPPELLAQGAELAAYRIVQEGLTNALKHAPGRAIRVVVRYRGRATDIEVSNEGEAPADPAGQTWEASGHGLTGLRDRVAPFRGTVTAGPLPDGGFRLSAHIPARGRRR